MAEVLRFMLAGSTGLLEECARVLLERGHDVAGLWTPDPAVLSESLRGLAVGGGLPEALPRQEFDYLLSVANPCILTAEALARPRRLAINYHDSPLPRYAGRHAAPRAILHGEVSHGVTWHAMTPRVDAGGILVQETFPLDLDETAFSLHLKCFEAALRTFGRLLEGLEAGSLSPVPQDLRRRTWFPSTDRLPDGGRLSWDLPARALSARVRSACFGPEPNDWGTCWFESPEGPLEVGTLVVDPIPWIAPVGSILETRPGELLVATADLPVRIGRMCTLSGSAPNLDAPCWRPGQHLVKEPARLAPVPETFARLAALAPDRPAVLTETDSWSYARLDEESNRFAQALLRLGLRAEESAAVLLERSPELVAAVLGVMKAGGAWLPLDPGTPAARLERILAEARPRAVISREAVGGWPWISPEMVRELPADPGGERVSPEGLAYVIYTSGSTGDPQGVMVEHRALSWFLDADVAAHRLGPGDRVLQLCSLSFDSSVEEIFSALTCGAAVALRPDSPDPEALLEFCRAREVTVMGLFPGMLAPALDAMERHGFPPTVRLVTTGGESVRAPDVQRWQAFFRERGLAPPRLVNNFGLTEVTVVSLACDLTERDVSDGTVPIGRPLPGTLVRVLGEDGEEALEGELYFGGPGLARGYLGQAERTEERFVYLRGERLFRSGDRVLRREDGELAFLGRNDGQVKVCGYRVELEEVEAALSRHPAVRECAVVQLPGGSLAAWAVLQAPVGPTDLRGFLHQQLPAWMVPARIEALEDLPRNLAGKVDRRSLAGRVGPGLPAVAASSPELEGMLALWREALGRPEVGPDWDFFDQGGDSLSALRLCSCLQGLRGRPVPLPMLARARTPRALLLALEGPESFRFLQPLRAGQEGPTTFFVHALGGSAEVYRELAARLGGNAIGFQAMQEPEHPSVEAMAERYLEELQLHQPAGPCHLVGLSLGGLIAFEMACRLARAGRPPGGLALIDTVVPGHGTPLPWLGRSEGLRRLVRGGQRLGHHVETLMGMPARDRLPYLRRLLGRVSLQGSRARSSPGGRSATPAVPTSARDEYLPGYYPGPILLLRCRYQTPLLRVDRALGWEDHALSVRVLEIPGLHGTSLLEPPLVDALAAALGGLHHQAWLGMGPARGDGVR